MIRPPWPAASGDDPVREAAGVDHQGHQEVPLPLPGHGGEALGDGEAGVVDQRTHPGPIEGVEDGLMRAKLGKVGRDRSCSYSVFCRELGRQRVQPVLPACDQREVVPSRCERARKLHANPRGGAGDQREAPRRHRIGSTAHYADLARPNDCRKC